VKLQSLWVDGYKNLNDIDITFGEDQIPIALIGNNGSGKSNIIEALSHIFMGLYYDKPISFSYNISYFVHSHRVKVSSYLNTQVTFIEVNDVRWSSAQFKRSIRESANTAPFPSLVFCYYSGTCTRLEVLLKKYERSYSAKLRHQTDDLFRNFVFSTIMHAEWILLGLLCHQKNDLLENVVLLDRSLIKIKLRPPRNYDPNIHNPTFWSTAGAIRDFISTLDSFSRDINENRDLIGENEKTLDRTYYLDQTKFFKLGDYLERRGTNLYSIVQALSANKLLIDISYELSSEGANFQFESLSEGEKQLLSVIGGIKLTEQGESLILLDEPDTHLNPAWSWKYNRLLEKSLDSTQIQNTSILLATHDPVLISGLPKEQVIIANRKINGSLCYHQPVRDPKGQGVANVLTSEFFSLPSSLDIETQEHIDRRLQLAYKIEPLSDEERRELADINNKLKILGLSISERDPDYKEFLDQKYNREQS